MPDTTEYEAQQIREANAAQRTPVVFIHGLWLLPSSWDRWRAVFEEAGYATLAPGWPDDPSTVEDANRHPEVLAHKSVGQIADHFGDVIGELKKKPALIGHSFGGLITQILAGRGAAAVSVAIDPAPFRGVLPLPVSALKSSAPVIGNPANRGRAIPLTYDQFRYAFANGLPASQAAMLAVTQRPIAFSAGSDPSGVPAWQTIPSWSLIGTADHVIPPAEQLFMSKRAHAHITEIDAGHLSLISHPSAVTRVIIAAAQATG